MGIFQTGKDAKASYDRFKKLKKSAQEYYETAKKLADADTRDGEIFKQGLKGMMKLAERFSGQALSKHPYFTFHKKHLEALTTALNASATSKNAMNALHEAVAAADSSAQIAAMIKELDDSKNRLKLFYVHFLQDAFETYKNLGVLPAQAAKELAEAGLSAAELRVQVEESIVSFRAGCAELFFDAHDLLAMVDTEARAAEVAYNHYLAKVKKLSDGKTSMERFAGLATERQRQLEWAERALEETRSGASPAARSEAIKDPSLYARQQRALVEDLVSRLARFCDAAMSGELIYPVSFKLRVSNL